MITAIDNDFHVFGIYVLFGVDGAIELVKTRFSPRTLQSFPHFIITIKIPVFPNDDFFIFHILFLGIPVPVSITF